MAGVATSLAPGVTCGQEGKPVAYASVVDNLCFIHWATQCKSADIYADHYWYPECKDWMKDLKPGLPGEQLDAAEALEGSCIFEKRTT